MKAYLFKGGCAAQKERNAFVSSSDAFAKIGQAYLRNVDLIYHAVNSIILYKLRYDSIYLTSEDRYSDESTNCITRQIIHLSNTGRSV